jgi:hypothetical protein
MKPYKHAAKLQLLQRIHQQRRSLSAQKHEWLQATAGYDRSWVRLCQLRKYILAASSLVALYNFRHPSRMIRWTKRALGIIGTIKLIRSTLQPR